MLPIDEYMIKRVDSGDIIVQGNPGEIAKRNFEDGWYVVANRRDHEELEVEKSGIFNGQTSGVAVKIKLAYNNFVGNDWYILDRSL
jgi:hypothetical protein